MTQSILHVITIYGLTALVFFIIDLFWLGYAARGLYRRYIGSLLRNKVNWIAAFFFYAIYIAGMQLFVVWPALQNGSGLLETAMKGGMLGLFAYSTFDLTSLALIKGWSTVIALLDIAWGVLLTVCTSVVVVWLTRSVIHLT